MAGVTSVRVDERIIFVYDVARSILLMESITAAAIWPGRNGDLAELIERLRIDAYVTDFELVVDQAWPESKRVLLDKMLAAGIDRLSSRTDFSVADASGWTGLPDAEFPWRGDHEPIAPIVAVGVAIRRLLASSLPAEPEGKHWWFGFAEEPELR